MKLSDIKVGMVLANSAPNHTHYKVEFVGTDYIVTRNSNNNYPYLSTSNKHKEIEWAAREIKPKIKRWANIYQTGAETFIGGCYTLRQEADNRSHGTRLACIEIEFHEGQGL